MTEVYVPKSTGIIKATFTDFVDNTDSFSIKEELSGLNAISTMYYNSGVAETTVQSYAAKEGNAIYVRKWAALDNTGWMWFPDGTTPASQVTNFANFHREGSFQGWVRVENFSGSGYYLALITFYSVGSSAGYAAVEMNGGFIDKIRLKAPWAASEIVVTGLSLGTYEWHHLHVAWTLDNDILCDSPSVVGPAAIIWLNGQYLAHAVYSHDPYYEANDANYPTVTWMRGGDIGSSNYNTCAGYLDGVGVASKAVYTTAFTPGESPPGVFIPSGPMVIRDKANKNWIDTFCQGGWKVRNAVGQWVPAVSNMTSVREENNSSWVELSCGDETPYSPAYRILFNPASGDANVNYLSSPNTNDWTNGSDVVAFPEGVLFSHTLHEISKDVNPYLYFLGFDNSSTLYRVDRVNRFAARTRPAGGYSKVRFINNKLIIVRYLFTNTYIDVSDDNGDSFTTYTYNESGITYGYRDILWTGSYYLLVGGVKSGNNVSIQTTNFQTFTNQTTICPSSKTYHEAIYDDVVSGNLICKVISGEIYWLEPGHTAGDNWQLASNELTLPSPGDYGGLVQFHSLALEDTLVSWNSKGKFLRGSAENWTSIGTLPNIHATASYVSSNVLVKNDVLFGTARDTNGMIMIWRFNGTSFSTQSLGVAWPINSSNIFITYI